MAPVINTANATARTGAMNIFLFSSDISTFCFFPECKVVHRYLTLYFVFAVLISGHLGMGVFKLVNRACLGGKDFGC